MSLSSKNPRTAWRTYSLTGKALSKWQAVKLGLREYCSGNPCRLVWVCSDIFLSLFLEFIVSREEICLPLGHFLTVWVVIIFSLDNIEQGLIWPVLATPNHFASLSSLLSWNLSSEDGVTCIVGTWRHGYKRGRRLDRGDCRKMTHLDAWSETRLIWGWLW